MKISPDTETIKHCLLCPDSDIRSDPEFSCSLGLIPPFDIQKCARCGLRWLSPRPTDKGYADLYSYQNYFEGNSVESYAELVKQRRAHFRGRIIKIEQYFQRRKGLIILDVGAATGEFVHQAQKRGHFVEGIELSAGAREEAKRKYSITLTEKPLEEIEKCGIYDVIHFNHVLEHLPHPEATLQLCSKLIKPHGLLIIEVPQQLHNDLDRLKKYLMISKKPDFNAYSLHHTYFFTPPTISQLVIKYGFQIKLLRTANPSHTPLWPPNLKNLLLRLFLWFSDTIHHGGNIIEIYASLT